MNEPPVDETSLTNHATPGSEASGSREEHSLNADRRSRVLAAEASSSDLLRRERGDQVAEENAAVERLVQRLSVARPG